MNETRHAVRPTPRITSISHPNPTQGQSDREFLPHVEGLRAVAVLAVLWYHIGLPGAPGGFTGVDIFFVISGFLITGLLLRQHETSGRIDLRQFYSRRLRRILPAVLAMIAVTMVVAAFVLAPLQVPGIAEDGAAAALSLGNVRFALESADYFAATDASPFRHLWSLGVEEQFYLVWPALLILSLRVLRSRPAIAVGVGAITVGSFIFALFLTESFAPWAFYSLPSRLWELSMGGLLAVGVGWLARVPRLMLLPVGWIGVGLVAAAVIVIDGTTPYPGSAALLPTFGAAALIVGGAGGPVGWILTREPVRFIGRISYSLYLWHWPILVLPALVIGEPLPLILSCALGASSIVIAAASWRLIEEPFRRGRLWTRRPRLVVATALATAVAVAGLSLGLGDYSLARVAAVGVTPGGTEASVEGTPPTEPEATPDAAEPTAAASPSIAPASEAPISSPLSEASTEPSAAPSASASTPEPAATPVPPPPAAPEVIPNPWPLPAGLRPALADARDDKERIIRDGCFMSLKGSKPPDCVYGNPDGSFTVALVGDSHAAHWFPAIETIAKARGWRLITFTKASCVFVDLPIYSPILKRQYTECEAWRPQVVQELIEEQPDLTIVSSDRWLPTSIKRDSDLKRQGEAMARLLNQIPGSKAIIGDTPASRVDVPVCLSQHGGDITRCATSRIEAFGRQKLVRERAAAAASNATVVDLSDAICPGDPCQAVVADTIVQRDDHHLTATFARLLAGRLEAALPISQ
jgi:peptidoglycan/LPS O-acetylase OafA/YrhL